MAELNQTFLLPDGRRLGYDERGSASGKPVFYFHGSPSSRIESVLYLTDELLHSFNIRLISVDRQGLGLSDFLPGRRVLDWPQTILALAGHLGLDQFAVLAYSLGGPYGLACAYAIPEHLTKVGIVSGAAIFTEPELMKNINEGTRRFLTMPRDNPAASRLYLGIMLGIMPRLAPGMFVAGAKSVLPEQDREIILAETEFQKGFLRMVREATRQGTRGAFHESLLTVTDRGFGLKDVLFPVVLWHGEADMNIPVEMARHAASALPNCEARILPNEGHLSLFKKYSGEILQTLVD